MRIPWCWFAAFLPCCASRECPPAPQARGEASTVRAALARLEHASSVDVLVISGGGSRGAWTAGVLKGLREVGKRPRYSVVTGVSTGALLATHAWLGERQDDETLARIYTSIESRDIFRKRLLLTAPFSDSLTTLVPLERLIAREITDHVIDRIAAQSGGGRALFVGTVNLDAGRLKVWNMVQLAQAGMYETYRDVLLASSSVPFLHSPVMIDGVMHVDGGTREQLLLREVFLGLRRGRAAVHVILNSQLAVSEVCVQPRLLDIAVRGVEVLTSAAAIGTLWQSKAICDATGAEWRLARIPDSLPLDFDSMTFRREGMQKLFQAGREFGRSGVWERTVPGVTDATRKLEGVQ